MDICLSGCCVREVEVVLGLSVSLLRVDQLSNAGWDSAFEYKYTVSCLPGDVKLDLIPHSTDYGIAVNDYHELFTLIPSSHP